MSFTGLLQLFQRPEVLISLVSGAALVLLALYLLRRRKANVDLESIRIVGEEEVSKEEEKEESRLSGDEGVRIEARILETLRSKGGLRPVPIPASKEGGHYPEIAGVSEKDARRAIEQLIEKGLAFEAEHEFSVISCPVCKSCSQVAILSCRNCGSFRVEELKFYRHTCGFIGPESSFKSGGRLVCPQCGISDGIETYHRRYRCLDCGAEFEEPNIAFKCGSCGTLYDEKTMEVKPFRRIESSKEMLSEYDRIRRTIDLELERLRREGYIIESPAHLAGESGVIHRFDAVAKKDDEIIAIASSIGEPVTQTLIKLGVAKSDLKLSKIILVIGRPAEPTEKEFAKSLGIEIVESLY